MCLDSYPLVSGDDWINLTKILNSMRVVTALNKILVWRFRLVNFVAKNMALRNKCQANNIARGNVKWMMQVEASKNNFYKILNADSTFNIDSLNVAQSKYGKTKTRMDLRLSIGGILSSPVIKNNTIYFGCSDGNIYALE